MKVSVFFILACLLLVPACSRQEILESEHKLSLTNELDTYLSALAKLEKFNGVVHFSQNGTTLFYKAYNLKQDTSHSLFVNNESQFDIHSVSKLMAQYLIFKLEAEGKINRQDSLKKYIPDFPKGDKITIQMLMEHRSGLPREFSKPKARYIDLETEQIIALAKQELLLFAPGEESQYSNIGYQLLYYIIGKVCEDTFEDCLAKRLFVPLEMDHSGAHFYTQRKNLRSLAQNHELHDDTILRVDNILEEELKQARIYSTTADLALMLDEFQTNTLAHTLAKDSIIQHSGGSDGIRAHVYCDLKTKSNFILLTNFDAIPFQKTISDIVKIIEGEVYEIPKKLNREATILDETMLNRYKGVYVFADMNNLELYIDVKGGKLAVYQDNELAGLLQAENDSTFFEDPAEPESFEFVKNNQGGYDVLMGWKGVKLKGKEKNEDIH